MANNLTCSLKKSDGATNINILGKDQFYDLTISDLNSALSSWSIQKSLTQIKLLRDQFRHTNELYAIGIADRFPPNKTTLGFYVNIPSAGIFLRPHSKQLQAWLCECLSFAASLPQTYSNSSEITEAIKMFLDVNNNITTIADLLINQQVASTAAQEVSNHAADIIDILPSQVGNTVEMVTSVVLGFLDVASNIPYVKPLAAAAKQFYGIYQRILSNRELFDEIKAKMGNLLLHLSYATAVRDLSESNQKLVVPALDNLNSTVLKVNKIILPYQHINETDENVYFTVNLLNGVKNYVLATKFEKQLQSCIKDIDESLSLFHTNLRAVLNYYELNNMKSDTDISKVKSILDPADFNSRFIEHCDNYCPNTRQWVFKMFKTWLYSAYKLAGARRLFVLFADQGMGKSVICSEFIRRLHVKDVITNNNDYNVLLIGSLFFQFNDPSRSSLSIAIKSLAFQIAKKLPIVCATLKRKLTSDSEYCLKHMHNPKKLFDYLIKTPLEEYGKSNAIDNNGMLIILDAIDEVGGFRDFAVERQNVLQFITQELLSLPSFVRILITTRPENDIKGHLLHFNPIIVKQNDIRHRNDLKMYIKNKLKTVSIHKSQLKWGVEQLMDKSSGQFIYLSHVFHNNIEFNQATTVGDFHEFIERMPIGIYGRYDQLFGRIIYKRDALFNSYSIGHSSTGVLQQTFENLLRIIVCEKCPLNLIEIAELLQHNTPIQIVELKQMAELLDPIFPLQQVTTASGNISFVFTYFHKSVFDWLCRIDNQQNNSPYIDVLLGNDFIANQLIKTEISRNNDFNSIKCYCYTYLIAHLIDSGLSTNATMAKNYLLNFTFVLTVLSLVGYSELLVMYQLFNDSVFNLNNNIVNMSGLQLVWKAIQLSGNSLIEPDSAQKLAFQVLCRLDGVSLINVDILIHEFISDCIKYIDKNDPVGLKPVQIELKSKADSPVDIEFEYNCTSWLCSLVFQNKYFIFGTCGHLKMDYAVLVYSLLTGKQLFRLNGNTDNVCELLEVNETTLVTVHCSYDEFKVWDIIRNTQLYVVKNTQCCNFYVALADNRLLSYSPITNMFVLFNTITKAHTQKAFVCNHSLTLKLDFVTVFPSKDLLLLETTSINNSQKIVFLIYSSESLCEMADPRSQEFDYINDVYKLQCMSDNKVVIQRNKTEIVIWDIAVNQLTFLLSFDYLIQHVFSNKQCFVGGSPTDLSTACIYENATKRRIGNSFNGDLLHINEYGTKTICAFHCNNRSKIVVTVYDTKGLLACGPSAISTSDVIIFAKCLPNGSIVTVDHHGCGYIWEYGAAQYRTVLSFKLDCFSILQDYHIIILLNPNRLTFAQNDRMVLVDLNSSGVILATHRSQSIITAVNVIDNRWMVFNDIVRDKPTITFWNLATFKSSFHFFIPTNISCILCLQELSDNRIVAVCVEHETDLKIIVFKWDGNHCVIFSAFVDASDNIPQSFNNYATLYSDSHYNFVLHFNRNSFWNTHPITFHIDNNTNKITLNYITVSSQEESATLSPSVESELVYYSSNWFQETLQPDFGRKFRCVFDDGKCVLEPCIGQYNLWPFYRIDSNNYMCTDLLSRVCNERFDVGESLSFVVVNPHNHTVFVTTGDIYNSKSSRIYIMSYSPTACVKEIRVFDGDVTLLPCSTERMSIICENTDDNGSHMGDQSSCIISIETIPDTFATANNLSTESTISNTELSAYSVDNSGHNSNNSADDNSAVSNVLNEVPTTETESHIIIDIFTKDIKSFFLRDRTNNH